MQNQTILKI